MHPGSSGFNQPAKRRVLRFRAGEQLAHVGEIVRRVDRHSQRRPAQRHRRRNGHHAEEIGSTTDERRDVLAIVGVGGELRGLLQRGCGHRFDSGAVWQQILAHVICLGCAQRRQRPSRGLDVDSGIVAGGANNQLLEERHGDSLEEKGILYTPDYVANAGGVINVYGEVAGWDAQRALTKADEIYDTVLGVFEIAKAERIPSYVAADRLAERRLESAPLVPLSRTPSALRQTPLVSPVVSDTEPLTSVAPPLGG